MIAATVHPINRFFIISISCCEYWINCSRFSVLALCSLVRSYYLLVVVPAPAEQLALRAAVTRAAGEPHQTTCVPNRRTAIKIIQRASRSKRSHRDWPLKAREFRVVPPAPFSPLHCV